MGRLKRFLPICLLVFAACGQQVGDTEAGIHIGDGPFENNHCEGVVDPGTRSPANFADAVHTVPSRLRSFSVTSAEGTSDRPTGEPLILTAKGGKQLQIELDTRFYANTRTDDDACEFYRNVCAKHHCWEDDGWVAMLNETFYTPLRTTINEVGPDFEAQALRYNNETKREFVRAVADGFADNQEELLGKGTYFCGQGYDREDKSTGCPSISVQLVDIRFVCDSESNEVCLEDIPNQRELAQQQEALAVDQAAAARAQQDVADAKNTPAQVQQRQLDIQEACANNDNCTLIINGSDTNVGASVPTG